MFIQDGKYCTGVKIRRPGFDTSQLDLIPFRVCEVRHDCSEKMGRRHGKVCEVTRWIDGNKNYSTALSLIFAWKFQDKEWIAPCL